MTTSPPMSLRNPTGVAVKTIYATFKTQQVNGSNINHSWPYIRYSIEFTIVEQNWEKQAYIAPEHFTLLAKHQRYSKLYQDITNIFTWSSFNEGKGAHRGQGYSLADFQITFVSSLILYKVCAYATQSLCLILCNQSMNIKLP